VYNDKIMHCIDMRDTSVLQLDKCDPETFKENFIEHLVPIGDAVSAKARRHLVLLLRR
jgi:hypothetical protein